jgi:hypothetical protein
VRLAATCRLRTLLRDFRTQRWRPVHACAVDTNLDSGQHVHVQFISNRIATKIHHIISTMVQIYDKIPSSCRVSERSALAHVMFAYSVHRVYLGKYPCVSVTDTLDSKTHGRASPQNMSKNFVVQRSASHMF